MQIQGDDKEIRWGRRLSKAKLRRLYESDAMGALDEDLLEDVGTTLLVRCESILTVNAAVHGKVQCRRCHKQGRQAIIERSFRKGDPRDEVLTCAVCGWSVTWGQYQKSFQGKQLNMGGAGPSFRDYISRYHAARTASERLLAIDRLIHEWHYSLRARPDLPTRPVLPNLIEGRLTDLLVFLDELTNGPGAAEDRRQTHDGWRKALNTFRAWRQAGYPTTEQSNPR